MYDSIAFASADSLGHKSAAALIADDDRHFAAISASLARSIADGSTRLDAARKAEADMGQEVMERDFEVHRLAGRLRSLRRYGLDLCLGHTLGADGQTYRYIGRTGLLDEAGNELLIDWRSPAAEPFFGAAGECSHPPLQRQGLGRCTNPLRGRGAGGGGEVERQA